VVDLSSEGLEAVVAYGYDDYACAAIDEVAVDVEVWWWLVIVVHGFGQEQCFAVVQEVQGL